MQLLISSEIFGKSELFEMASSSTAAIDDSDTSSKIFNEKSFASNSSQPGTIPCCLCGTPISAVLTPQHMCLPCLERHVDIAAPLRRPLNRRRPEITLEYCKKCYRYYQPPGEWVTANYESPELLKMCLRRIRGLKHFHLCNANFISPEKDSQRFKIQLLIESKEMEIKAITNGNTIPGLRRSLTIDYFIRYRLCPECHRMEAKDYWHCVVQLRQHTSSKCWYDKIQKLIAKHRANEYIQSIKPSYGGFDYYFAKEYHARKFVDFLESMVPVRVITSSRLVSHNPTTRIFRYKYTWSVEIAPVSCDSLVCLPIKLRQQVGQLAPICLIYRIASGIHLMDPWTCQTAELNASNYFRTPFDVICNPKQLLEYIIMDIETIPLNSTGGSTIARKSNENRSSNSHSIQLCDIWLVRAQQLGSSNQNIIHTRSHLGNVLAVGDSVLAYNLKDTNINGIEFDKLKAEQIPDVVVVRKCADSFASDNNNFDDDHVNGGNWSSNKKHECKRNTNKKNIEAKNAEDNLNKSAELELTELLELLENEDEDIVFFAEEQPDILRNVNLANSWKELDEHPLLHLDEMLFK